MGFACACALSGSGSPVDLNSETLRALRRDYRNERAKTDAARTLALTTLVQSKLAETQALSEESERRGNASGMAVARWGVRLFERCAAALEADGDFSLPDPSNVRRELAGMAEDARRIKTDIEARHARACARLNVKTLDHLVWTIEESGGQPPAPDERAALFHEWLQDPEPAGQVIGAGAARAMADPASDAQSGSTVIAQSGAGDRWVTLATFQVEVGGIEVVEIPLLDRREPAATTHENPLFGSTFTTRLRPVRVLTDGAGYAFRLRELPDLKPVELMTWPTANDWTLAVRVNPRSTVVTRHGAEIQVCGPGAAQLEQVTEEGVADDKPAPAERVRIAVETEPPGAAIYVDRKLIKKDGSPMRTPFTLELMAGPHQIVFMKRGCKSGRLPNYEAVDGAVLTWTFVPDGQGK